MTHKEILESVQKMVGQLSDREECPPDLDLMDEADLSSIEIMELLSGKEHLMKFSEGYIQGDRVTVTKGPLKGLEGSISRIDRHRRLAWLTVELFGRTVELQAGLEVIRKE